MFMPRVDLSTPTYRRLLARADSFEDTAEDVVRRLLDQVGEPESAATELGPDKRFRSRATPGSILPERSYWLPILRILKETGGSAQGTDVIDALGSRMRNDLTPADYEVLNMGEVRWRNRARFARLRMKERGLLSSTSPRGIWEITDAGRLFLEEREDEIA